MNFINLPGTRGRRRLVEVPSGQLTATLNAGYDPVSKATVTELPYKSRELSLILILPGKQSEFIAGGLSQLEGQLNASLWNSLMSHVAPHKVNLKVPFFNHRTLADDMRSDLMDMGMEAAFKAKAADFQGINGVNDLWLSQFSQLNEIVVDQRRSSRLFSQLFRTKRQEAEGYKVHFERQFMYAIRHNPSGLILYIGRYYEPTKNA